MYSSNCSFLTCIQISQEAGKVVWYSQLFKNFPEFAVIHTVKGFGIVNKVLVLYWTGTWWSRVEDERVKEGKRLLHSQLLHSRESAKKRERERHGTQALMEQRCFNQYGVGIYSLTR